MFRIIIRRSIAFLGLLSCSLLSMAGVNPLTVSLQAGAATTISQGGTGSANYLVTLNLAVPGALTLALTGGLPSGVTQVTTGTACGGVTACTSTFNLTPGGLCCLKLLMTGSNMTIGSNTIAPLIQTTPIHTYSGRGDILDVTVASAPAQATLSAPSALALSVNDTTTNAALTGHPRQITITNSSTTTTAYSVGWSAQNLSPANPTITSNATPNTSCGDIAPLSTCVLTITPVGATPSATAYDLTPTTITLTITGNNTNSLTSSVNILTYGSVYQGGYVYSVDDAYISAPITGSVGGKVVSLEDQADPYTNSGSSATSTVWSSNGAGIDSVSEDIIPSISDSPTPNDSYSAAVTSFDGTYSNTTTYPFPSSSAFLTCSGATDGACNSHNILALYTTYITNYSDTNALSPGPTPPGDYPAGLCTATISGYSGWYFPAICEMDSVGGSLICPTGTQSMVSSLPALIGDPGATTPSTSCSNGANCLAGFYWSSTEVAGGPRIGAWNEGFVIGGSSQNTTTKDNQLGVRCSRAF